MVIISCFTFTSLGVSLSNHSSPFVGVLLAVVAILPITFIAVTTLFYEASDLINPCVHWGTGMSGSTAFALGGSCSVATSASETIPQAILRLTLIQGGILISAVLGVVGVVWSHPRGKLFSSIILFA